MLAGLTAAILSQLDSRLSRLDKTIQPLGIREKATFQSNVDAMLDILDPGGARPTVKRQESHGGSNGHGSPSLSARSPLMTRTEVDGSSPVARNPPQRHVSIMDRTRAIDRRDKLPRWAEDAAARQSHVSTAGARSPAPTIATDVTSLRQEASPIATTPVGTEKAILARGIDPMAPGEFFGAMQNVIEDIERMDRGIAEGRGGSREAGINELVSVPLSGTDGSRRSCRRRLDKRCSSSLKQSRIRFPPHSTRGGMRVVHLPCRHTTRPTIIYDSYPCQ